MSNLTKFNLRDYNTGQYSVVTRNGVPVEITAIDDKRGTVFGFFGETNQPSYWYMDGSFNLVRESGTSESVNDLFLTSKRITVHVNITRNKSGKIDCYASTRGRAKVKAGGILLKYMVVDIEE
jgi:hypothetical protein